MSAKLKSFSCGTWRMALKPNSEELGLLMLILAGLAFEPEPLKSDVIMTCLILIPASSESPALSLALWVSILRLLQEALMASDRFFFMVADPCGWMSGLVLVNGSAF